MSDHDQVEQAAADAHQDSAPAVAPAEIVPLPEILRQIARDSASKPREYLDETTVPYGGE